MLIYRRAVQMANRAHEKTGARYFVMPNISTKILLIVTDRKNFRGLRAKHYIDSSMRMEDVFKRCFYFTPRGDEEGLITEDELKKKQIEYQLWYQKRLHEIPNERKAQRKRRRAQRKEQRKRIREIQRQIRRDERKSASLW